MRCVSAILVIVCEIVLTNGAVNYCGAKMCGHTNAHTLCKYRPGPSASCTGYIPAALSPEEKARVVTRLNRRRSELARGWRHWPPAGDMMKLRWIEELSHEAQRWADQCRPPRSPEELDTCRDLYSISVGQCVASIVGEAPGLRPETMVDMWYMQSMAYDGNVTTYIPSQSKNFYGDFAQMMWSRTFLVGCGRSRFMVEWRGRLRSVERLVCNFAPRGPLPARPLWSPAHPAAACPPRARRDTIPGLCTYQNNFDAPLNVNDSLSVQQANLLETVFEIERNESLNYLGSLDEHYLTKMAIATIGTTMANIPLYYSLHKRNILDQIGENEQLLKVENDSEVEQNTVAVHRLVLEEKTTRRTKSRKAKVNVIGRPKPYDINELNDATLDQKFENINDIEDLKKNKENDLYAEYGLVETEEDIMNITTLGVNVTINNNNINNTELTSEFNEFIGVNYTTVRIEELNSSVVYEKSFEDYLSDPETVQALQEALANMERTLASSAPVSTSGKVRRELRNLDADSQTTPKTESTNDYPSTEIKTDEVIKEREWNKTRDRGPMLSMVLKYMPYLKPYESSIIGGPNSSCNKVYFEFAVFICSLLVYICVL